MTTDLYWLNVEYLFRPELVQWDSIRCALQSSTIFSTLNLIGLLGLSFLLKFKNHQLKTNPVTELIPLGFLREFQISLNRLAAIEQSWKSLLECFRNIETILGTIDLLLWALKRSNRVYWDWMALEKLFSKFTAKLKVSRAVHLHQ